MSRMAISGLSDVIWGISYVFMVYQTRKWDITGETKQGFHEKVWIFMYVMGYLHVLFGLVRLVKGL